MNIAGSGYRLDQMSGMIIRGEGEKFYGTRWDHGDLDIRHFRTQWEESAAGTENISIPEPEEGPESISIPEPEIEPKEMTSSAPAPEEKGISVLTEEIGTASEAEMVIKEKAETEAEAIEEQKEDKKAEDGILITMEADERCRNFGKILDQCPGMYPFEDDGVEACVRLEPQDIGMMPIDCWSYGSNSFLLHGYYSYRHLILARLKPEEERGGSYILGVPGTRHSREAFMANMFGFREFKPIREGNGESSDFGYWYTFLA